MDMRRPEFDTRLIIYRGRQIALGIVMAITTFFFALFIINGMEKDQHWLIIGIPVCIAASGFVLFPNTEKWEYKPWQAKSARVERDLDH